MSQNDLTIANQGFASFRSDLNSALQALGSTNSGTSAPSTTFANQLFYDTTNNILKIRNEDNDAFISLFTLDQTNDNIEALTISGTLTYTGDLVSSTAGTSNFRAGVNAGNSITSGGNYNVTVGDEAGTALTTGDNNVTVGYQAGGSNTTLTDNTLIGYQAGANATTSGHYKTAVGSQALLTGGGGQEVAIGYQALYNANTSSAFNVAIGYQALDANTTATNNTAVGHSSLGGNTTGAANVAVGRQASLSGTTAYHNVSVGYQSLYSLVTGGQNVAIGYQSLYANTADNNLAIGQNTLDANTSGSANVAIGNNALGANTTATYNTAVGYQAGLAITTGIQNTILGEEAGKSNQTGIGNTFIGSDCGFSTTGGRNSFFGKNSGESVTSGTKNTILGSYSGNQGNLDIRTSSNNVVLSDGDGNVRSVCDSNGSWELSDNNLNSTLGDRLNIFGKTVGSTQFGISVAGNANSYSQFAMRFYDSYGSSVVGSITFNTSSTTYATSSDYRLKENVVDMTGAIDRVKQLFPKRFNFVIDETNTLVDGFMAHEAQTVVAEAVTGSHNEVDDNGDAVMQGIDQSKLVPLLTGALKEAIAKIEALETRVATLEGA
jgi:hypothetical protein